MAVAECFDHEDVVHRVENKTEHYDGARTFLHSRPQSLVLFSTIRVRDAFYIWYAVAVYVDRFPTHHLTMRPVACCATAGATPEEEPDVETIHVAIRIGFLEISYCGDPAARTSMRQLTGK